MSWDVNHNPDSAWPVEIVDDEGAVVEAFTYGAAERIHKHMGAAINAGRKRGTASGIVHLDDLAEAVRKADALLRDRQPGLMTWSAAMGDVIHSLRAILKEPT